MTSLADHALEQALVRRVVHQLGLDLTGAPPLDVDASFFDTGGFRFAGLDLDSMSFVEMLVGLEEQVGIALLDAPDVAEFDSISRLAAYVARHGDPVKVAALRQEWS